MSIHLQILGQQGEDNAVLVTVDTGQHLSRVLMDCGEQTVSRLSMADSAGIDHVLFSHFHMDHCTGFDSFFRRHYDRSDRINHVWGPPGTAAIMGHRFRGFVWNLIADRQSSWHCHDIGTTAVDCCRYELADAFAVAHNEPTGGLSPLWIGAGYELGAVTLDHGIASIGYTVRELPRLNVDVLRLQALGLKPGPWLKTLATDEISMIQGVAHESEPLRQALLQRTVGDSMAYITDFIAESEVERERIADHLAGVRTLVCECQYRADDAPLARRNQHMTTEWVGRLAGLVRPERLLLTHFSTRYHANEWAQMLGEVQRFFPAAMVAQGDAG
jgi:ribonuclease Z